MVEIWHIDLNLLSQNEQSRLLNQAQLLDPNGAAHFPDLTKQLHRLANRYMIQARTGCDINAIQYTSSGKPFIKDGPQFSVAHDANWVLVAFSDHEVGIDIQAIEPRRTSTLIERFHPEERSHIQSLHETEQLKAFYRIWTRKEAFLKACGKGMTIELYTFSVLPNSITFHGKNWHFVDVMRFEHMACSLCISEMIAPESIQFTQMSITI
jgi:phosphopantetheine--protein transferase-like protein